MKLIRSIARRIRKRCEDFACSKESNGHDFHDNEDLSCMCAVASFALHEALKRRGIRSKVIKGCYYLSPKSQKNDDMGTLGMTHCWLEVDDKIVDITATQFDVTPKVYIVSNRNQKYRVIQEVTDYDFLRDWGCQRPSPKLSKKLIGRKHFVCS
jgi:hypothetical protein